jgi:tRNA nucleotidyltransferase (CCA-adding enzyme)
MQFINIEPNLQKTLQEIMVQYPKVSAIVGEIAQHKGRALLVGGAVRDLLLGLPIKDLDIEVYGISIEQLESILKHFGFVSLVGKSFGVLRLHGLDVDWSIPRADSAGRKPRVATDPFMSFKDAFGRRDLTINAMGIDLVSYELVDPYNGQKDLHEKRLRAPRIDLFIEDPLRFYRVMQFVSRFEMKPDIELNHVCATMNLKGISVERIEDEFEKLFLKSQRPSLGLRWIHEIGRLQELLPELAAVVGVPQDARWHPEGDVFEHSMQSLDASASMIYESSQEKLIVMIAALCHDLGKATTTEITKDGIISYEHDIEGAKICLPFLKRITRKLIIFEAVPQLVRYHMQPLQFVDGGAKPSAYKRLARKLAPNATITMLAKVALADSRGRNPFGHDPLAIQDPDVERFLYHAQQAQVEHKPEEPILHGRDIIDWVEPGPEMGKFLKKAYEIQLEEGIKNKEELKRRILQNRNE